MSEHLDDLTVAFSEDGIEVVKELDKKVLSRGAWTTILFRYQDWDKAKQAYSPDRYTIRRYQKRNQQYWLKSKFNISSADQARMLVEYLSEWLKNDSL